MGGPASFSHCHGGIQPLSPSPKEVTRSEYFYSGKIPRLSALYWVRGEDTTGKGHQEDVSWPHQPQVLPGSGTCLHTYDRACLLIPTCIQPIVTKHEWIQVSEDLDTKQCFTIDFNIAWPCRRFKISSLLCKSFCLLTWRRERK
ncbi:cortexin-3 isoform X2 [Panthera tigris]|uniref:cortexin-3 isoform X2 n=1 Tax=Panthera tigris TaxID=9694 RepID=UPI001C6FA8F6|nr:cortexin-3 isoform X2 [Panthera tigris]